MNVKCWADQEGRKALSRNNAKGLTTLKQKCKKYFRDYKFEAKLSEYKQVCEHTGLGACSCALFTCELV